MNNMQVDTGNGVYQIRDEKGEGFKIYQELDVRALFSNATHALVFGATFYPEKVDAIRAAIAHSFVQ